MLVSIQVCPGSVLCHLMILKAKEGEGGTSALRGHGSGSGQGERSLKELPFHGVAAILLNLYPF